MDKWTLYIVKGLFTAMVMMLGLMVAGILKSETPLLLTMGLFFCVLVWSIKI